MPSQRVSHASIADALDRVVPDFDALIQKARLGSRHPLELHELEAEAQAIAAAIVAPFRKPQPAGGRIVRTGKGVWACP
ncbi:hypothetical protein [Sphingomonas sp.]|jgi:hypothetical protein|uniref:hypothetical protein n=1 Tax=Sphingomonas sp. TaxID=28214 RepID=UPI003BADAE2F